MSRPGKLVVCASINEAKNRMRADRSVYYAFWNQSLYGKKFSEIQLDVPIHYLTNRNGQGYLEHLKTLLTPGGRFLPSGEALPEELVGGSAEVDGTQHD